MYFDPRLTVDLFSSLTIEHRELTTPTIVSLPTNQPNPVSAQFCQTDMTIHLRDYCHTEKGACH